MNLEDGKDVFENIKIPKELEQIVCCTINGYSKENHSMIKYRRKKNALAITKYAVTAAAAILICFSVVLNTNEAFAKEALDIPVIGQIAKVLTVRSYEVTEENKVISVKVPAVDLGENQSTTDANHNADSNIVAEDSVQDNTFEQKEQFVADFNAEINKIVDDYLADAQKRCAADKEAFIATGGTEEEWAQRDLNITVDYEVKYEQGNLLSLVLMTNESWYGAYDLKYYYNMNLEDNKKLMLKDVLGENFKDLSNNSIISQMKDRAAQNTDYIYWGVTDTESEITGFTSVDENTKFYMNEEGKPVVCFAKYEVAPGFMGEQEFVIE
jgi:phage gp46-like protein